MKICTLLLLVKDNQILLGMKKRGFGADRWNGFGGKVEAGESLEQAAVRECREEAHVIPQHFWKVAEHDFIFPDGVTDMRVHTYLCDQWEGKPTETDEMAPQWFELDNIPYDAMWQDDRHWLPRVLDGQKLHCRFTFDKAENLLDSKIHEAAL